MLAVVDEVERLRLEILVDPILLHREKLNRNWPLFEKIVLIGILAEAGFHLLEVASMLLGELVSPRRLRNLQITNDL